jgi:hypothetical protein
MRIAVSGSYSTGKTLTTMVLAEVTGFPKTHAKTMREILPSTYPGKKLEQCSPNELIELIMRRNVERITSEKMLGSEFISDGASIQEWAYCFARLKAGFNPNEKRFKSILRKYINYPRWKAFKDVMNSYGNVVKAYAKDHYDLIIHLPIEFPFDPDGHRPINERFRVECDNLLREAYKEIGVPVFEVTGSISERVTSVCKKFKIPYNKNVDEIAIRCAQKKKQFFDSIAIENAQRN